MLFQLGSSVVSVWVFCCFSLGLLLFQSGSSLQPPHPPDGKVGIRVAKKLRFFRFILRSTSDDWPSDPSNKSQPKCKKGPLSHQKIKCLLLDYVQLLVIGQAIQAMKVNQSHQKMKYSFLYYIQLLMIGQAIRVMKVDQNVKKSNVVSVRVFCCLSLGVLLFQSGSSVVSVWVFSTPPTPQMEW